MVGLSVLEGGDNRAMVAEGAQRRAEQGFRSGVPEGFPSRPARWCGRQESVRRRPALSVASRQQRQRLRRGRRLSLFGSWPWTSTRPDRCLPRPPTMTRWLAAARRRMSGCH